MKKCLWVFILSIITNLLIPIDAAVKALRNQLSDSILHYESLTYDKKLLYHSHSKVRRSLDPNEELHLNFKAHSREFKLRLRRDTSSFTDNVNFDSSSDFHPKNLYSGYLQGYSNSLVHGFIHDDIFEGRIHDGKGEEFHIESAKQYKNLDANDFHSVIYNVKDIKISTPYKCGGVLARTQEWMNKEQNYTARKPEDHVMFDDHKDNIHHRQKRASVNPKLTECRMYLRADWTFRDHAGSDERAMYIMTQHLVSVSHIYSKTDFNKDGNSEGYTLKIQKIAVMSKDGCTSSSTETRCKFADPNIGVEKFLDLASLDNHDEFCLSYVFSHREFSDGVLGLAWIGDTGGAGGICDKYQMINSVMKSLNSGILTNLNYGKTVALKVTDITLAHEIGHNFGSQHDPATAGECSPGGSGGNFIMFPRATSGSEPNNIDFSTCSRNYIWPVLNAKSAKCFKEQGAPICGNRVVEAGEECDCGYLGDDSCKNDTCCTPSDGKTGCKFSDRANAVKGIKCSPSLGFCCNPDTCSPFPTSTKRPCLSRTDCAQASFCLETNYTCPTPQPVNDKELCNNNTRVCINGECTGSLCLIENNKTNECQCTNEEELCDVCCQYKNDSSTCKSLKETSGRKLLAPGSPCNKYSGYCDILNKCRKVDAEGPLSRLKKWLFSSQTFDTILDWMKTYWWACVLIGLGLVLFMAGFIACCSVHTPSSNPNKPPARQMTLPRSLSRRRNPPSAPPAESSQPRHRGPPNNAEDSLPGYNTAVRDKNRPPRYNESVEMM